MKSELIEKLLSGLTRAGVECGVYEINHHVAWCIIDGLEFGVWVVKDMFYEFRPKLLQSEWTQKGLHTFADSLHSKLPTPRFNVERSVESWVKQLPSRLDVAAVKEYHKEFQQSLDVARAIKAKKRVAQDTIESALGVSSGSVFAKHNGATVYSFGDAQGAKLGFSLDAIVGDYKTVLEITIPHDGNELAKVLQRVMGVIKGGET